MKPKTISLLWCKGIYVVVEDSNGPTVTNQTDGCGCGHPSTQGHIIPMPRTFDGMVLDKKGFFNPADNYLKFPLDGALEFYQQYLLANGFNEATITGMREAWVQFTFVSNGELQTAVLTWENSD